ncbi:MAG: HEAT repeat domain-containing protein [Leptospirales bacterium]|nr:HEAT repeat domain-containing protein [Leptospirales bacterium]
MKKRFIIMFTIMAISSIVFAAEADKYIADLDSQDEKTVTQAADWLGEKKEKSASTKLVALLSDPRDGVRIHAVQALGYIGEKDYVDSLNQTFLNDKNSTVRYAALLSIIKIKDDKSKSVLQQAKETETDPFIVDLLTKLEAKDQGK